MPEAKFKIGDVVTLNSGSAKMTVSEIHPDASAIRISCVYRADEHASISELIRIHEDCFIAYQDE